MQIPVGNFGQTVARPGPMPTLQRGDPIGDAAIRTGGIAGNVVNDMAEQQTRLNLEQKKRDEEARDKAEAAQTVAATAQGQEELRKRRDELTQGIVTGQVDKTKAADLWRETSSKFVDTFGKDIPESRAAMAKAHLLNHALELGDSVRKAVQVKDIEDTRAGLFDYLEMMERRAVDDREGSVRQGLSAIEQLGPFANLGADDRQKLGQKLKENTAFNAASALVRGARDDQQGLDQVLTRIKSPEFADMSPEKVGQLEQRVLGRKQYLESKEQTRIIRAEAAAARRERQAEGALKATQSLIDNGGVPDDGMLTQVQAAVSGTAYAPALTQMLRQASQDATFAQLTPQQQQTELLQMRAKANAQGTNPQLEAQISSRERIAASSVKQLREDPLVYGMNRRLIDPVEPLHFGDIPTLVSQMGDRIKQAQTVGARVGQPVSPLLASEAHQVADMLAIMPTTQRHAAMQKLVAVLPEGDKSMVRAMSQQIEPKDRTLSLAMFAAGKRAPNGEYPSLLMLQGQDAAQSGRIKDNDEPAKLAQQKIAQELSQVPWATPQGRDAAIDATYRVWLGLRDRRQDSVSNAITIATNGLASWGDSKIPLPSGMSEREFRQAMGAITPERLAKQAGGDSFVVGGHPVNAAALAGALPKAKLIPLDDGVYAVESGGAIVRSGQGVFRLKVGR